MSKAMSYEIFLRNAFGCNYKGDDPASLASADCYNLATNKKYFNKVKAGVCYAVAIYNYKYGEEKVLLDPDDYNKMDCFLDRSLTSQDLNDISKLIEDYKTYMEYLEGLDDN